MKRRLMFTAAMTLTCVIGNSIASAANIRPQAHEDYAKKLWNAVTSKTNYRDWKVAEASPELPCGPCVAGATVYLNKTAAADPTMPYQSVVVAEHSEGDALQGVTVWYRMTGEFDPENQNWYFAHYLPDGTTIQTSADNEPYAKHGFVTALRDGRLWVFRPGSADLAEFQKSGEPAKHVIVPGGGPSGITIKAPDQEIIEEYLSAKPGFVTAVREGRLWVFRPGSKELSEFYASGEPAKHVIRPGAGPGGTTIKAPDGAIIEEYLYAKPGFEVRVVDGRLWVFKAGSEALSEFESAGEPAKHVIRPGIGPGGMTIKGEDADTILAYLAQADGFVTEIVDGRIWVFRPGSEALAEFRQSGEPAKSVIRPAAGPGGATVKAADDETLEAYLRATSG